MGQASPAGEVPGSGFLGQVSRWVEAHPKQALDSLNDRGIYPTIMRFTGGTGAAPGLTLWRPDFGTGGIDVFAAAARSFRGDQLLEIRLGRVPHRLQDRPSRRTGLEQFAPFQLDHDGQGPWFLYFEVRDQDLRSGRFIDAERRSLGYELEEDSYDLVSGFQLGGGALLALRAGSLEALATLPRLDAGTLQASSLPPQEWRYFRTQATLAVDTRDHAWDPRRGGYLEASWARYADRGTGGNGFDRSSLELRRYLPLTSTRHVLALRALGTLDRAETDGSVPVFLQRTLGGSDTLRAFEGFRFRGTRVLSVSAEYRFELTPSLELAAFYDGGRAWGGPETLGSAGFRSSHGVGLRFKSLRGVLARVDLARGPEGHRAHLKLGCSF